ncbi:MAG TPA: hypothetical protein VF981_07080 [Gemmatimonadaceae bacterium]
MSRSMRRAMLIAALAVPVAGVSAQERYSPVVLHLSPTPRAAVLGSNPGVRDVEALFSNPALAGLVAGTVAGITRYDAASLITLASAASLGSFNVSIGAQYLAAHADAVRLPLWSYSLMFGGPIPVSSVVGSFALSSTVRGMRVGAALKVLDERQGSGEDHVPSLDLGLSRDIGRITTGLSIQNIGAGIRYGGWRPQLPLRISAGAATYGFVAGPFDLGGSAAIAILPDGDVRPSAGFEVGYVPLDGYLFQARVGLRRPELQAQQPFSFGGSASLDRFTLDYAYEDWEGGSAHRLALRVR